MNLIDYLPPFLQDVKEFKEIFETEDVELDRFKAAVNNILKEVIVKEATSYGLDRYEKIYGIESGTDIEERRFKILSKINNKLPFSYYWLVNKMDNLVGRENYDITLDNKNYRITIDVISLFKDIAIVLNKDLREQLPANLVVTVNLYQYEECTSYFGGIVHIGDNITIRQVI